MADGPVGCPCSHAHGCCTHNKRLFDLKEFPQYNKGYLEEVSGFVSKHRHDFFPLQNPDGATWKIGNLQDTIYSGEDEEVKAWENFYLEEAVSMEVIGVVEGTSCPEELVLMTCEDGQLYAYDGEQLHLVASSVKQLEDKGMEYPATKSYYEGEAFKNMKEECAAVEEKLDKEHHDLMMSVKSEMLENLKSTRNNTSRLKKVQSELMDPGWQVWAFFFAIVVGVSQVVLNTMGGGLLSELKDN